MYNKKCTFSYSNRRKCITNLYTLPKHFRQDFTKYKTQSVIKIIYDYLIIVINNFISELERDSKIKQFNFKLQISKIETSIQLAQCFQSGYVLSIVIFRLSHCYDYWPILISLKTNCYLKRQWFGFWEIFSSFLRIK